MSPVSAPNPRRKSNRPHLAIRARYRDGELAVVVREQFAIGAVVVVFAMAATIVAVVLLTR